MKKWYVISETHVIPLGEHEDFEGADMAILKLPTPPEGPEWIMSEDDLRKLRANISEVLLT